MGLPRVEGFRAERLVGGVGGVDWLIGLRCFFLDRKNPAEGRWIEAKSVAEDS